VVLFFPAEMMLSGTHVDTKSSRRNMLMRHTTMIHLSQQAAHELATSDEYVLATGVEMLDLLGVSHCGSD
jgi:hypothetical protein